MEFKNMVWRHYSNKEKQQHKEKQELSIRYDCNIYLKTFLMIYFTNFEC